MKYSRQTRAHSLLDDGWEEINRYKLIQHIHAPTHIFIDRERTDNNEYVSALSIVTMISIHNIYIIVTYSLLNELLNLTIFLDRFLLSRCFYCVRIIDA